MLHTGKATGLFMILYAHPKAVKRWMGGCRQLRHDDVINRGALALLSLSEPHPLADSTGNAVGYVLAKPEGVYVLGSVLWQWPDLSWDRVCRQIDQALNRRLRFGLNPSFVRVVFGSSDNCAGWVLDRYGSVWVAYAYHDVWWDWLSAHEHQMRAHYGMRSFVLKHRTRPTQVWGEAVSGLWVEESGRRFWAEVVQGQKTGWYYDQRANRAALLPWVQGGHWVDLCCYYGAFGVTALDGGAAHVSFVDRSPQALATLAVTLEERGYEDRTLRVCEDVADWLVSTDQRYDGVMCDPPCFSKSKALAPQVVQAYRHWIRLCLRILRPEGILVFSSCTSSVRLTMLKQWIIEEIARAQRQAHCVYEGRADRDHPVAPRAPETDYLCCLIFRVV